ncbi:MAG: TolC family outer membrane protein [Azonexus sp.]
MRPTNVKRGLLVISMAGMVAVSMPSHSETLVDAYRAARVNDSAFLSAAQQREATAQAVPLAASALMPQISYSYGQSKITGERRLPDSRGNTFTDPLDYTSKSNSLNLRMPLINVDALVRLKQSFNQSDYGDANFSAQEQNLAIRVTQAYLDVLLARHSRDLAEKQQDAYGELRKFAANRLRGGEGTRTEEAEAESRFRLAQAQLIEAENQLYISEMALNNLTGWSGVRLKTTGKNFRALPLDPPLEAGWVERALESSPVIEAARKMLAVAEDEVHRNRAGHLPKLDLVGGISKTSSETVNTIGQEYDTRSIGFQLNLPIFSGGYVYAGTNQAIANREKSRNDLEGEIKKTTLEVRRQFQGTRSGLEKIGALTKAVESSEIALQGAQVGLKNGFRTNLDVLDAQRVLYSAKRDLAQAHFTYLMSLTSLRAATGVLAPEDMELLDRVLHN